MTGHQSSVQFFPSARCYLLEAVKNPWSDPSQKVSVSQFAQSNDRKLPGDNLAWDTTNTENDLKIMREVEERKLLTMANVHDILEMWQGT